MLFSSHAQRGVMWVLPLLFLFSAPGSGQNIKMKNAQKWTLSGKVQLQHLYNASTEGDAGITNNGFRIRRGRLQIKTNLTEFISTKFQIEVRDNSPRLKDAEGKITLPNNTFLRFGQFKAPVWREELRSSSKLFLVERSLAAAFLAKNNFSARHIGVEFGLKTSAGAQFAVNYSNGAGEGSREDAGRRKNAVINNGKMLAGRIELPLGKKMNIGFSAVRNSTGMLTTDDDTRGTATLFAPDFNLKLAVGSGAVLEVDGGLGFGSFSDSGVNTGEDKKFTLLDISGEWKKKLGRANESLGGLDGFGFAAGFSSVDFRGTTSAVRFGPTFTFGKQTRLQLNAELINPENGDRTVNYRSMITFNY